MKPSLSPDIDQTTNLAGCIIINDSNELLLLHRNTPEKTQWETPGGKVEPGETLEQAAIHETQEELTTTPKITKLIGEKSFQENQKTITITGT